jgi:hypothetical protein
MAHSSTSVLSAKLGLKGGKPSKAAEMHRPHAATLAKPGSPAALRHRLYAVPPASPLLRPPLNPLSTTNTPTTVLKKTP